MDTGAPLAGRRKNKQNPTTTATVQAAALLSSMRHIPSEIWIKICSEACTDTGFTGLSLSLVSKFIRAASEPFKLQSVALFGPHRIIAFDSFLLEVPAHLRRIRYLFISYHSLPTDGVNASRSYQAEVEAQMHMPGAIQRVLENVADYVEVLEIHAPPVPLYSSVPIRLIPFPRLTDLATDFENHPMHRLYRIPTNMNGNSEQSLYPRLRNWHLTQEPLGYDDANMFRRIAKLAPSLTHLRLSGIGQNQSFLIELASGLRIEYFHHGTETEFGRLPSSVQKVYLKPSSSNSRGERGIGRGMYLTAMMVLRDLNQLGDERLVVLKAYEAAEEQEIGTRTADWESTVRGEEGCWSLRDAI